jgi:pimeloyl-ACP methyl ester carboxylesterase
MVGIFTHSTLTAGDLEVAYVDEGQGPPVLLLHGWPTSSFLYREIVPVLAQAHRVVVPDLPGFGATSKPLDRQYSFELFAGVLDALVERLGLDAPGLVVHDLGGPIGVHWALHRPGRVSRVALLNTLLYPDFGPTVLEFVTRLMDERRRGELVSDDGLHGILRLGVSDPDALSPEALAGVAAPFDTDDERRALALAGIGLHPGGFAEIARLLPSLDVPVLGLYGADDRILPDVAETFARVGRDLPHAQIEPLTGVGHFLQEEAAGTVAARLAAFFAYAAERTAG